MRIYLLDTNIASHVIKGDIPQVRERLVAVPIHSVAVSVVTQAELLYGVAKRGHPQSLSKLVNEFLAHVDFLPWTLAAAHAYGALRATCEASGVTLAHADMMIAAHAKALSDEHSEDDQAVLVTRDRVFSRVPGLNIEDWTEGGTS